MENKDIENERRVFLAGIDVGYEAGFKDGADCFRRHWVIIAVLAAFVLGEILGSADIGGAINEWINTAPVKPIL